MVVEEKEVEVEKEKRKQKNRKKEREVEEVAFSPQVAWLSPRPPTPTPACANPYLVSPSSPCLNPILDFNAHTPVKKKKSVIQGHTFFTIRKDY